jgi:DNA-binding SARP family transcriptional activator
MLTVVLFGSVSASLETSGSVRALTLAPRVAELLAFLALGRGEYFSRADIADSIWGDQGQEITAGTLNTALWRLRRSIEQKPAQPGDFLVTNRHGAVGLNGPRPVTIDVAEFDRQTRPGLSKPIEQLSDSDRDALRASISLYRGNVLSEFCGSWALRERERLRNTYLNAAGRLMHLCALRREYDDAIHYARLVLALDELREDVHRDLMRYLVCNGQRALALRQFEVCRAALHRELAIQPMIETMTLYRQIAGDAMHSPFEQHRDGAASDAVGMRQPGRPPSPLSSPPLPERPGPAASAWAATAADQVQSARHLLAEADDRLQKTLDLIQH